MNKGAEGFFRAVVDSVHEHIAVIASDGRILYVNSPWQDFGLANNYKATKKWEGVNYLTVCDKAADAGDSFGKAVSAGARQVIRGDTTMFSYEYPCHSPDTKRWFLMRITPLNWAEQDCYVISHLNITERKLAEQRAEAAALEDSLTSVANRRHFDNFLKQQLQRDARQHETTSLLLVDIDSFKAFNDNFGHQAGDRCLIAVAQALEEHCARASDLCARYGGEEFSLVLGNTKPEAALGVANNVLAAVRQLNIAHPHSTAADVVTVSIGVASITASKGDESEALIAAADAALYRAKQAGRNQLVIGEAVPRAQE